MNNQKYTYLYFNTHSTLRLGSLLHPHHTKGRTKSILRSLNKQKMGFSSTLHPTNGEVISVLGEDKQVLIHTALQQ